ncbi:uncharacterized protein VTP21DRAFT_1993 [Calcarisporiella thermophila]|uniref:uncharacterized protein n=1 Tax=Calcarisporiella thermophila TaxID=911321 RepID=UPI0037444445
MADQQQKTILYSYFRSSCSWRVRIALEHKGIPYELKPVNLLKNEHKSEVYTQLQPFKEVPTLLIDGLSMTQSIAILEYLEETRPEKPLLPKESHARVQVRTIVNAIACDIQPINNLRVLQHEFVAPHKVKWIHEWVKFGFDALESILKTTAGKCCVGDEVTFADLALAPQVYNALRFEVDMTAYPTIHRIYNHLLELEAFKTTYPHRQPDCPAELREN